MDEGLLAARGLPSPLVALLTSLRRGPAGKLPTRSRRRGRYDSNSSLSLNFDPVYEAEAQAQPAELPKIIEFPRPTAPPVVEELAEPVVEKPRILEAEEPLEEVVPPSGMAVPCASLGLGFLWALVDEDGLGWHDRITRTCVRE